MAEEKREKQYWLHRITGGENGKLLSYPLLNDHDILSIGWSFISTEEWMQEIQKNGIKAINKAYKEEGVTPTKSRFCLLNFICKMQKGDYVVVPHGAYFNVYQIADDEILTNESIPYDYLEENKILRKTDGLYTLDGEYIDLGFYRHVEPIAINLSRSQADDKLYAKMRSLRTNIEISDVSTSIEILIEQTGNQDINAQKTSRKKKKEKILTDFHVRNYKNLINLNLTGLRRLNLFVGANNTGKSNLLEAIFLYASNLNHERMMEILQQRKENMEYFDNSKHFRERELLAAFAPFFPKRSVDRMTNNTYIEIGTEEKGFLRLALMSAIFRNDRDITRLTRLTPYGNITSNQKLSNNRETVLVTLPREDENTGITAQKRNFDNVMHMTRISNNGIDVQSTNTEYLFRCQLLNCKHITTQKAENIWSRISLTEMEDIILDALQIIDKRTQKFNFVKINSNTYQPMVLLEGEDYKVPISEMGDGMTHVLNIIIALLDCANGILLLDEAESGLHYATQNQLWEMIFDLAKKYNVQVFASTHSNDCIKAFAEADSKGEDALVMRLEREKDSVSAVYYRNMADVLYGLKRGAEGR